jgi:hypothetical protein
MKSRLGAILCLAVAVWLVSCGSPTVEGGGPVVNDITVEEVRASGTGGCGMTLRRAEGSGSGQFVFFHGIATDSGRMRLDGLMLRFWKESGSGEPFFGQEPSQRFRTPEGRITVEVEVSPGDKNDRGVIPIESGTIRVKKDGRETVISVTGDAGC